MKKIKYFSFLLWILILTSCSPQRVLVLTDPVFDYFAAAEIKFYKIERLFIYCGNGFFPEFVEVDNENNSDVQNLISSGRYSALVTGYLDLHNYSVPEDMDIVLIGGSREVNFETVSQVVTSNTEAYRRLSRILRDEWEKNGRLPVTVLWKDPRVGDDEIESLMSAWQDSNKAFFSENMLVINESEMDVQNRIETFLRKYDFTSQSFLISGLCPPILEEFLSTLPREGDISLTLSVPDNPVLPDSVLGIITPSYKMLLKASVRALKESSTGDILEIQNIYKNK